MKTERVFFYLPSLEGGGAEKVTLNLIHALLENGTDVSLILSKLSGPYTKYIPNSLNLIDLRGKRAWLTLPRLVKILRNYKPKVLISGLDHVNLIPLIASKLGAPKCKVYPTVHIPLSETQKKMSSLLKLMLKLMIGKFFSHAPKIVTVSDYVAFDLKKTCKNCKTVTIYNPVISNEIFVKSQETVTDDWFTNKSKPIIISVGRLDQQKDYVTLLEAFAILLKEVDSRLLILGDGSQRSLLEKKIKTLNLGNNVKLPGFVENPYKYLAKSDLFVLSSIYEGLPTVIIEAIALGLPLVLTDCPGGNREIIKATRYSERTIFCKPRDPEALAEAMLKALKNKLPKVEPDLSIFTVESALQRYLQLIYEG